LAVPRPHDEKGNPVLDWAFDVDPRDLYYVLTMIDGYCVREDSPDFFGVRPRRICVEVARKELTSDGRGLSLLDVMAMLQGWLDAVPEESRATAECVLTTESLFYEYSTPTASLEVRYWRDETEADRLKRKKEKEEASSDAKRKDWVLLADVKRRLGVD